MLHLNIFNLPFSANYLSGNTFLTANFWKSRRNGPFWAFLVHFCPLKIKMWLASLTILTKTFPVLFKHREEPQEIYFLVRNNLFEKWDRREWEKLTIRRQQKMCQQILCQWEWMGGRRREMQRNGNESSCSSHHRSAPQSPWNSIGSH